MRTVDHAVIRQGMTVDTLINEYGKCGFGAGRVFRAAAVLEEMLSSGCTTYFGLAGAMVAGGMRRVVADLILDSHIDVLVTTGANIVHDLVDAFGAKHHFLDDAEDDVRLREQGINRVYDVYVPDSGFGLLEERLQTCFDSLGREKISVKELLDELGSTITDKGSILYAAHKKGVPIYCPAFPDSVLGLQGWLFNQTKKLEIDLFQDMGDMIDLAFTSKKNGCILIGGGVPKNYILQSMLLKPESGFDYALQITTDTPQFGGLSGATLDEAKSWGKVKPQGDMVTVYGDATIILPLLVAGVRERLGVKANDEKRV